MSFVHLHLHTPFSFLDGAGRIEDLVERAAKLGMPALAITDHNRISGVVRFQKACQRAGLKPILGAEVTLRGGAHLTLIAKDRQGYANLCRILTDAHLQNERKDSQVPWQSISEHCQGLIALSGCRRGEIPELVFEQRFEGAKRRALRYADLFGRDNFYIELQQTLTPGDLALNRSLIELAKELNLKVVATNNVHYARKREYVAQDVLTCIRTLTRLDHPHAERKINAELYLKSPCRMRELFAECPEAVANTMEVSERCESIRLGKEDHLPSFPLPEGESAPGYLRKLVYKGAVRRYGGLNDRVKGRLEYELSLIERLGFSGYFLLVWDVVKFARSRGIRYAGRGSAADSAVAYCLDITKVDAVSRNLRFERFINPERANNLPDIDIDFDARFRDEVTDYLVERYGRERVATVCTFSRYRARGALRDIGKALGFPPEELNRLAGLMPSVGADEIEGALDRFPELRQSKIPKQKFALLLQLCHAIADHPRHIGTHLGGVVITKRPITEISPLEVSAKGVNIIQFDKDDVEELGLVKLDLLCLRMLSAVEDSINLINRSKERDGQAWEEKLDFDRLPLDDRPTYELLHTGETAGAFQLESSAQRALQRRLKAKDIEDIIASVALIRPGPVQADMVDPFLLRRHGRAAVTYLHPALKGILEKTYGVVLFQEQVVEIAVKIAGFSPGEADLLRRTMTHHRSRRDMEAIGRRFIEKALARGVREDVARTVFSYIRAYAGYGFCEAHAAAFGDTAYKTAYLLRHYPAQFYAAILNNQPMGFYPPHTLVMEAKRRGITVLGPDVNSTDADFDVEGEAIRVGLKQVRGISRGEVEGIIKGRPFGCLEEFLERTSVRRDVMENLILCGALDSIDPNRRRLMWLLGEKVRGRVGGGLPIRYYTGFPEVEDYTGWQKLCFEWEILGFSPEGHPMEYLRKRLREEGVLTNREIKGCKAGTRIKAAGLVVRPHRPPTRSGRIVVFLSLEDETGLLDVTVFEDVYQAYGRLIFTEPVLLMEGYIGGRGTASLIAERIHRGSFEQAGL